MAQPGNNEPQHASYESLSVGDPAAQVVEIQDGLATVDLGFGAKGKVPLDGLTASTPGTDIKVGEIVQISLDRIAIMLNGAVPPRSSAQRKDSWRRLEDALKKNEYFDAIILFQIWGGFAVNVDGVLAFLPDLQAHMSSSPDAAALIGSKQLVRVLQMDGDRGIVVVSRRSFPQDKPVMDGERRVPAKRRRSSFGPNLTRPSSSELAPTYSEDKDPSSAISRDQAETEAPDTPPSRSLNAWTSDASPKMGTPFELKLNIGSAKAGSLATADFVASFDKSQATTLLLSVANVHCEITPSWQELILPPTGDSGTVIFTVVARKSGALKFTIRVYLPEQLIPLQSLDFSIDVLASGSEAMRAM